MLSTKYPENRVSVATIKGISSPVQLLSYPDLKIQEHAATALLNLSNDEVNKRLMTREGAIPDIIEILHNGSIEAKENSVATLFI